MNEYYFHLDHLTVGYDKKPLIKDICIGIEKGEIVTLIGPNGSGKSTILKSITRQLKLVGGNVEFDGKNLHELSFRELSTKMAVVLTERMKPELMTCHDIVATGRYPYTGRLGMLTREDEEKVEKAMRAADLIISAVDLSSARRAIASSALLSRHCMWLDLGNEARHGPAQDQEADRPAGRVEPG